MHRTTNFFSKKDRSKRLNDNNKILMSVQHDFLKTYTRPRWQVVQCRKPGGITK